MGRPIFEGKTVYTVRDRPMVKNLFNILPTLKRSSELAPCFEVFQCYVYQRADREDLSLSHVLLPAPSTF